MLTSPELISVTAETSHPQPRKMLSTERGRGGGGANDKGERREEKDEVVVVGWLAKEDRDGAKRRGGAGKAFG